MNKFSTFWTVVAAILFCHVILYPPHWLKASFNGVSLVLGIIFLLIVCFGLLGWLLISIEDLWEKFKQSKHYKYKSAYYVLLILFLTFCCCISPADSVIESILALCVWFCIIFPISLWIYNLPNKFRNTNQNPQKTKRHNNENS